MKFLEYVKIILQDWNNEDIDEISDYVNNLTIFKKEICLKEPE
jgi:hypothetical protein